MKKLFSKVLSAALIVSVMCLGLTSCGEPKEEEPIPEIGKAYTVTIENGTGSAITCFKVKDSANDKLSSNKILEGQSFDNEAVVSYTYDASGACAKAAGEDLTYCIKIELGEDNAYTLHEVPFGITDNFKICLSEEDGLAYIEYVDADENEVNTLENEIAIKKAEEKAKKEAEEKAKKEAEEKARQEAAAYQQSHSKSHKKSKHHKKSNGCVDNASDLLY